jgi:hypothetical protein
MLASPAKAVGDAFLRFGLLLVCGLGLAGGFVYAGRQHFAALSYGYETESLRRERDQLARGAAPVPSCNGKKRRVRCAWSAPRSSSACRRCSRRKSIPFGNRFRTRQLSRRH